MFHNLKMLQGNWFRRATVIDMVSERLGNFSLLQAAALEGSHDHR